MGREIRKVPANWEHPKDDSGRFIPMMDESFDEAFNEWMEGLQKWIKGENPDAETYNYPKTPYGYTNWNGRSPDPETYRKESWTEDEACCFQIYENVSEGTPVSPVFTSKKEMEDWLVGQGYSRNAAHNFCESEYAPSMTFQSGVGFKTDINTCED